MCCAVLCCALAHSVGKGVKYISDNLGGKLKKRKTTKYDVDLTVSRVVPLADDDELWKKTFKKADMVIEAVPENMDLKHKVIKQAEQVHTSCCGIP